MENTVNVNDVSRISAGTIVKGEISSPGDLRIDGCFEGRILAQGRVVVGEKAVVKGDILCRSVDFCGKMEGNFFVKDTLTLKGGCSVQGDLHVKRLQVELDARFDGHCQMIDEAGFDKLAAQYGLPQEPRADKPEKKN